MPFFDNEFYPELNNPKTPFQKFQLEYSQKYCWYYKQIGVTAHQSHQRVGKEVTLNTLGAQLNYLVCKLQSLFDKLQTTAIVDPIIESIESHTTNPEFLEELRNKIDSLTEIIEKIPESFKVSSDIDLRENLNSKLDFINTTTLSLLDKLVKQEQGISSLKDTLVREVLSKVLESDNDFRILILKALDNKVEKILSSVKVLEVDPDHPNPTELQIQKQATKIHTLSETIHQILEKIELLATQIKASQVTANTILARLDRIL